MWKKIRNFINEIASDIKSSDKQLEELFDSIEDDEKI